MVLPFFYWLNRVILDKIQQTIKWLCVVCVGGEYCIGKVQIYVMIIEQCKMFPPLSKWHIAVNYIKEKVHIFYESDQLFSQNCITCLFFLCVVVILTFLQLSHGNNLDSYFTD